jgi:hypothetical protein
MPIKITQIIFHVRRRRSRDLHSVVLDSRASLHGVLLVSLTSLVVLLRVEEAVDLSLLLEAAGARAATAGAPTARSRPGTGGGGGGGGALPAAEEHLDVHRLLLVRPRRHGGRGGGGGGGWRGDFGISAVRRRGVWGFLGRSGAGEEGEFKISGEWASVRWGAYLLWQWLYAGGGCPALGYHGSSSSSPAGLGLQSPRPVHLTLFLL